MIRKVLFTIGFLLGFGFWVVAQTTINRNAKLRLIGQVQGEFYNDTRDMLKDFTLGVEWWTLLAEPVELYNIKWSSTDHYKIEVDGQTVEISRNSISKYPDLLQRFDCLKPTRFDLIMYGHADGKTTSVKRGSSYEYSGFSRQGTAYKKDGQSFDPYTLSADIVYRIPDHKLLLAGSEKVGKGLVPGSPPVWNEFWMWKSRTSNNSAPNSEIDYTVLNKPIKDYQNLSEGEKRDLDNELKYLFMNSLSVSVKIEIENLEWPEAEMISIAKRFDEYESGKREPSPIELVEEAESEIEKLDEYKNEDFWGDLETLKEPTPIAFEQNGKWGVKYDNTDEVIIPAKYYKTWVHSYCIVAQISDGELCDSDYELNNCVLFDLKGNLIISEPFAEYLSTENSYNPTYINGKESVVQLKRVYISHYTSKSYARENNLRWVPWTGKCEFIKISSDLEVLKQYKSDTEYRWGFYRLPCDPDR